MIQYSLKRKHFESSVQISSDTKAEEVLKFIELDMTLYGEEGDMFKIREMTRNTKEYDTTKLHVINNFSMY